MAQYDESQVLTHLRKFVADHGTQTAAAEALEISFQHLSDLLHQRRPISDNIAGKLGFTKKVVFEEKQS